MTLWRRIVIAQVVIGLVLALALPLLIDRTIRGIGDDLTGRSPERDVGNDDALAAAHFHRANIKDRHPCRHPRSIRRATLARGSDIAR